MFCQGRMECLGKAMEIAVRWCCEEVLILTLVRSSGAPAAESGSKCTEKRAGGRSVRRDAPGGSKNDPPLEPIVDSRRRRGSAQAGV